MLIWNKQKGIKQMRKGKNFESLKIPFVKLVLYVEKNIINELPKKVKQKG